MFSGIFLLFLCVCVFYLFIYLFYFNWRLTTLQYCGGHSSIFAWRIPTDRGAWQATVHRFTQSWTRLKQLSTHSFKLTGVYIHWQQRYSQQPKDVNGPNAQSKLMNHKHSAASLCYEILFRCRKEWNADTCYDVGGPQKHYAQGKKPGKRSHIVWFHL